MKRCYVTLFILFFMAAPAWALPSSPIQINGQPYAYLQPLAQGLGFQYVWDPFLKNVTLKSEKGSLKFHIGSEFILHRGRTAKLEDKVLSVNGAPAVPLSALPYLDKMTSEPHKKLASTLALSQNVRRVVIDAGHGGKDFGAVSPWGPREKDVTLEMARLLADSLKAKGFETVITRHGNAFIPLSQRARLSNKINADLFVSIHANAAESPDLKGFEVYRLSEATDDLGLAVQRAENSVLNLESASLQGEATDDLKGILWDMKQTKNRRDSIRAADAISSAVGEAVPVAANRRREANFYVLKWTECPSVLIELGYLTNREDVAALQDPAYKARLVQAITEGIVNYRAGLRS